MYQKIYLITVCVYKNVLCKYIVTICICYTLYDLQMIYTHCRRFFPFMETKVRITICLNVIYCLEPPIISHESPILVFVDMEILQVVVDYWWSIHTNKLTHETILSLVNGNDVICKFSVSLY